MRFTRLVGLALSLVLVACGGEYDVRISFVDSDTKLAADRVQVAIVTDCAVQTLGAPPTGTVRSVEFRTSGTSPAIGDVEPGAYGLYARASDANCNVIAAGCTPILLEAGTAAALSVQLRNVSAALCAPAVACVDGQCAGADAGSDGGVDGSVDAIMTRPDADSGPQPDTGLDGGPPADVGPVAEGIPVPVRSVITDAADRLVITFDRNVGVENGEGFTIRGADGLTVTGASAVGPVLTLVLSEPAKYLQNAITWSYNETAGTVQNLRDLVLIHVDNQIAEPPVTGLEYFVSADGTSGNTGLSEASPWSIEHAVTRVAPGDKVWIKAGEYAIDRELRADIDGQEDARIWFEGYRTSTDGVPDPITSLYFDDYNADGSLDASELPLFRGNSPSSQDAFDIRGLDHVTFRNLTFTNFANAFYAGGESLPGTTNPANRVRYLLFERIAATNFGANNYSGFIVELGQVELNEYNTVRSCRGQDMANTPFFLGGRGMLVADNKVWGVRAETPTTGAQNYGYIIKGDENVMIRNRAHNTLDTGDSASGFRLSGDLPSSTEYNLVQDNVAFNLGGSFQLRNETTAYNVLRNNVSDRDATIMTERSGGLTISGGAHHNLVEGHVARGVTTAITFHDNRESENNSCGHDNVVRNSIFFGVPAFEGAGGLSHKHAIQATGDGSSEVTNNRFVGCTFHDFSYFLRFYPAGGPSGVGASGNEIINCSLDEGLYFKHPDTIAENGFAFSGCNLYRADLQDGGFSGMVGSNGNVSQPPRFMSTGPDAFDFHLMDISGNIDRGLDRDDLVFDMDGRERPQGGLNDIGAFER